MTLVNRVIWVTSLTWLIRLTRVIWVTRVTWVIREIRKKLG